MTAFQKCLVLFLAGVAFAAAVVLSFVCGQHHPVSCPHGDPQTKTDTLLVRDTIHVYEPEIVEKTVYRTQLVPIVDTLRLHDTLFVALERTRVAWRDAYSEIWASGVDPEIDSVRHYITTKVVTVQERIPVEVKVRPKWSVGIGAGVVAAPVDGSLKVAPAVGISVQRVLLSW